MIKGMTINDATHKWVSEFNAIPQSMIERLMRAAPDVLRENNGCLDAVYRCSRSR